MPNRPGGGDGDRPGRPGGGDRPSRPSIPGGGGDRPTMPNRPGGGDGDRPGRPGGGDRPSRPSIPGGGGDRPTLPNRPGGGDGDRPGRPGGGDRPSRPSIPGGGGDRPTLPNRPGGGDGDRPGRPGGGDRPSRPSIPGDRPGRPGGGDRPDWLERPGRPGRPDRPIIGGDRIHIGDNNIAIGNNNRARWGYGRGRPGWGYGGRPGWGYGGGHGHWANHWNDHYVNHHHHNWYHSCWSGNWGNSWYVPLVYGATAWGVSAALPSWGYSSGYSYSNPYYEVAAMPAYDYSQPIVINTYNSPASEAAAEGGTTVAPAPPAATPKEDAGYELFDNARSAFKRGDYRTALRLDEQAVAQVSSDPVIHEFGALCLFALGQYDRAAPVLNALLAVAPGMDWATMSSLYDDVDTYTNQLRELESHVRKTPDDVAARFVLAYHYLVAGHTDEALEELKYVVEKQPADLVAKRMYDALQPVELADADVPPPPEAGNSGSTTDSAEESTAEQTDLIGTWLAERDGSRFHLTITEDGKFQWKAKPEGQAEITLSGNTSASSDMLILESGDQGSMVARVASGGPDEFQFLAVDGPPGDPGLTFKRSAG